jgi:hypothetical protein
MRREWKEENTLYLGLLVPRIYIGRQFDLNHITQYFTI